VFQNGRVISDHLLVRAEDVRLITLLDLYLLCACGRKDCDAINEICSQYYVGHPTRNTKRRLVFEIGDKVCCTKNASVKDVTSHSSKEASFVRLCNGEIFFIKKVSYTYTVSHRTHDHIFNYNFNNCPIMTTFVTDCMV